MEELNLGFGTTNPRATFHLVQNNVTIRLQDLSSSSDASTNIEFINGNTANFSGSTSNTDWCISNSNSIFRIQSGSNKVINNVINFTNSGYVGIGADNPQQKLHIIHANNNLVRIETDTNAEGQTSGIEFGIPEYLSDTRSKITSTTYQNGSNDMQFYTSSGTSMSTPQMTIDYNGNIGIGTSTNLINKLNVNGTISATYFSGRADNLVVPISAIVNLQPTLELNDSNTSNYIAFTSNILVTKVDLNDSNTSNYIAFTSNILVTKVDLNDTNNSNYVTSTSNILVTKVDLNDSNTSNYIASTSDIISKRITDLNTDMINENPGAFNRFIVNDEYKRGLTVYGDLTVTCNLTVNGNRTILDTYVYTAENLEVVNINVNSVALMVQQNNSGSSDIFIASNQSTSVFNIANNGDVNISGIYKKDNRDIIDDTSNYVTSTSNILIEKVNLNNTNNSNYVTSTSNILIEKVNLNDNNCSNYIEFINTNLISLITKTDVIANDTNNSNYVTSTSNILIEKVNLNNTNNSNYVTSTSNILIEKVNLNNTNNSNYVTSTSNILIEKVNLNNTNNSNYVTSTSNILVGCIIDTSNILIGCINDTSNYVARISTEVNSRLLTISQIPILATSNITGLDDALSGKQGTINSTANQIIIGNGDGSTTTSQELTFNTVSNTLTTSNITVTGDLTVTKNLKVYGNETILNTIVYTTEKLEVVNININSVALMVHQNNDGERDIFIASNQNTRVFNIANNGDVNISGIYKIDNRNIIEDTSNYVTSASNILVSRILSEDKITSNILIGRINNTSNYVTSTSNTLIGRINDTSNYVTSASNILVSRILFEDKNTSNILIGRINDTSNYIKSTSNILIDMIKNNKSSQWTTSNNNIYYNTSNVGIGTIVPTNKLHLYDDTNNNTKLTIQNNYFLNNYNKIIDEIISGNTRGIITNTNDRYTIYTSSSSFTIPPGGINCDILMIGGGGSSGGTYGGGGAGACIIAINKTLPAGSCVVNVGDGGAAGSANKGGDSYISVGIKDIYRAKGGGQGGPRNGVGGEGGCGGGAGYADSAAQGVSGGSTSSTNIVNETTILVPVITSTYAVLGNLGGNSGAAIAGSGGGIGSGANSSTPGIGLNQVIINNFTYNFKSYFANNNTFGHNNNGYIGGGGGGYNNGNVAGGLGGGGTAPTSGTAAAIAAAAGAANTGSGGGGASDTGFGGGGSGIVIIRYRRLLENSSSSSLDFLRGNTGYNIGNYDDDFKIISSVSGINTNILVLNQSSNITFSGTINAPNMNVPNGGKYKINNQDLSYNDLTNKLTVGANITIDASNNISAVVPTTFSATAITSGTLSVPRGGTGLSTITSGNILFGNGTGAIASDSVLNYNNTTNVLSIPNALFTTSTSIAYLTFTQSSTNQFQLYQGVSSSTDVRYGFVHKWNNTSAEYLTFRNGHVGIGQNNPECVLEVGGTSGEISNITENRTYFQLNSSSLGNSTSTWSVAFKVNGRIWATTAIMVSSDSRIKEDIQDINDDSALQMILAIEPKTYKYIDKIEKTDNKVYGFIAQQVREVIPDAVNIQKSYIPNIVLLADYVNKIITLLSQPTKVIIKNDDKIKCYDKDNKDIYIEVEEVINELTFKIKELEKEYTDTKIFVYGTQINDFHTLDKNYIFTLNVCATQELHRRIEAHKVIIQSQEDRIKDLETKMAQILNNMSQ